MRGKANHKDVRRFGAGAAIGLAVMAVSLVAACTPHVSSWSPSNSPKENKVGWVSFSHVIAFGPGKAELSRKEQRRLRRFLAEIKVGNSDHVLVGVAGRLSDSRAAGLADRRSVRVTQFLRRNRVFPRALPTGRDRAPWDGSVSVVVGRYVVTTPSCPDWTKPATGDPANRVSSNFGCATTTNLGLMVADPGDLIRGRPEGPADAATATGAVRRYRGDAVKEPEQIKTKSAD